MARRPVRRQRAAVGRGRESGRPSRAGAVPNLLVLSILATVLCCQIGGIIAIVFSVQANGHRDAGRTAEGHKAARTAKTWLWISFWTPALIFALYAALIGAGVLTVGLTDQ